LHNVPDSPYIKPPTSPWDVDIYLPMDNSTSPEREAKTMESPTSPFKSKEQPVSLARFKRMYPGHERLEELSDDELKKAEWREKEVDLVKFEKELNYRPIFTRKLLEQFVRGNAKGRESIEASDIDGRQWFAFRPEGILRDWYGRDLEMTYQGYCELSPDNRPEIASPAQGVLQGMNKDRMAHENEYIPLPVGMSPCNYQSRPGWDKDLGKFGHWEVLFNEMREYWTACSSATLLREKFTEAAKTNVKINKIVCIGFGALRCVDGGSKRELKDQKFLPDFTLWSPIQHFAAFTIADTLNKAYRVVDPDCPLVKILFQDPLYEPSDKIFWELNKYNPMEFVQDPEGILAIDENTFVMTAHLPHWVPLLQIIADLVDGGPAGFICDKIPLDPEKRMWRARDRGSPKVVRMLTNGYVKTGFEKHEMEIELWENVAAKRDYWLWKTDCFLKPKPQPEPLSPEDESWNPYSVLEGLEE